MVAYKRLAHVFAATSPGATPTAVHGQRDPTSSGEDEATRKEPLMRVQRASPCLGPGTALSAAVNAAGAASASTWVIVRVDAALNVLLLPARYRFLCYGDSLP